MENVCAVVLAAGEGKRMKSDKPKVLSEVLSQPMLKWVIDAIKKANINEICVVAGFKHEMVKEYISSINLNCDLVVQHERKGTAHAVIMAEDFLKRNLHKEVLILNGDAPFIDEKTIKESFSLHQKEKNSATVISATIENPFGYGRIVRDEFTKNLKLIVEQKDADENTQRINEVSSGAYWFNVEDLLSVIHNISNDNIQNEFYLPDAIKLLLEKEMSVNAFLAESSEIVLGANDKEQLEKLNDIARSKF